MVDDSELSQSTDSDVLCGPVPATHGPGTAPFEGLVKSVATAASRVGAATYYGYFFWREKPPDVVLAVLKIEQAHKLLLGAHALLAEAHKKALGI